MGVLNTHLRTESSRNLLFGLVENVKVDILVVAETWFEDQKHSDFYMSKTFGDNFSWFSVQRQNQFGGGLGILVRKSVGTFSLVKGSDKVGVIWIKLEKDLEVTFIGGVYFPPSGSVRKEEWKKMLENLENDIIEFRKQGKVMVLGDFNVVLLRYRRQFVDTMSFMFLIVKQTTLNLGNQKHLVAEKILLLP